MLDRQVPVGAKRYIQVASRTSPSCTTNRVTGVGHICPKGEKHQGTLFAGHIRASSSLESLSRKPSEQPVRASVLLRKAELGNDKKKSKTIYSVR